MKCMYCGEEEGTVTIPDPNDMFSDKKWNVCEICKEVIMCQRNLSVCKRIGDKKMVIFYNGELIRLAEKSGKQILSCQLGNDRDYNETIFGKEE